MFEQISGPRIYSQPIGCDFSQAFVAGLIERVQGQPPHKMAQIDVYVNTARTMRRMKDLFHAQGAGFLPRFRLITDLSNDPMMLCDLPPAAPQIRRILRIGQLVRAVLHKDETIAPATMTFDLANSLSGLMDEVQGENVDMRDVINLDVAEHSAHWQRSKDFLSIIAEYWDQNTLTDPQDRMRHVVESYTRHWQDHPPTHPILVVGSTGSRGETAAFMKAVANLPQGAVVLPGLDDCDSETVWNSFKDKSSTLDHPQAGYAKLFRHMGIERSDVKTWQGTNPNSVERNRLLSLAMRPAPITNQWLNEGPALIPELPVATRSLSLLEANTPKEEALAISVCLRHAAEQKTQAVLITPNRELTRRVSANLSRWGIEADDSAGLPLNLLPPGVFLRSLGNCFGRELTPLSLIALLKHTLTHTSDDRAQHNLNTQRLEIKHLRGGPPFVDFARLSEWGENSETIVWVGWIKSVFAPLESATSMGLSDWLKLHIDTANLLAAGPSGVGSGQLWEKAAGIQALKTMKELIEEQDHGGVLTAAEYNSLIKNILTQEVREDIQTAHPLISIWGTLEARVQGAELVILGGLNEGVWPEKTKPDMWMNRDMRNQLGLLLPERSIGLSAHDFQQAVGAPNVVLSRSLRDGDALANASRWVIRLTNLMEGMGEQGKATLKDMKGRGNKWIALARKLDVPVKRVPPATRPAPIPPKGSGIKQLSVTQVQRLIRNPFEIYARTVLNLRKLQPLGKEADAMERGIAIHDVIETFMQAFPTDLPPDARSEFMKVAADVLAQNVPWPSAQRLWLARLERVADAFMQGEQARRDCGQIIAIERAGKIYLKDLDFTLKVKADRLDAGTKGLRIYDYKAGATSSKGEIEHFDKQLHLEAVIASEGGFDDLPANTVEHLEYVSVTNANKPAEIEISPEVIAKILQEFIELIAHYNSGEYGFAAHDKEQKSNHESDYDHLSRKGEWELSDKPDPRQVP